MTLQARDRRALAGLAVTAIISLAVYFWPQGGSSTVAVAPADSVGSAEKRLARLRDVAATVPQKEQILKSVRATLAEREAGLLQADTAAQAQAQLLQILRRLCAAETPPIEIRATELSAVTPIGEVYGLANLAVQIECPIEQVVNLLADIAAHRPELITTTDLRITPVGNPRDKIVGVRLAVAGVVPEKLVPRRSGDKKGGGGL